MSIDDRLDDIFEAATTADPVGNVPWYYAPVLRYITDDQQLLAAALQDQYGATPWRDEDNNILVTMPDGTTYYLNSPHDRWAEVAQTGYHWLRNQVVPTAVSTVGAAGGMRVGATAARYIPLPAPLYAIAQVLGPLAGAYLGQWAAREAYQAQFLAARERLYERYGDYEVPPPHYLVRSPEFDAAFGNPYGGYPTTLADYSPATSPIGMAPAMYPSTLAGYFAEYPHAAWPQPETPAVPTDRWPAAGAAIDYAMQPADWRDWQLAIMSDYSRMSAEAARRMAPAPSVPTALAPVSVSPITPRSPGAGFTFANPGDTGMWR